MPALMDPVEFRSALENAIKGKSANKSPFSIAWAEGKLSRTHLSRWAENHYHYVGPFADYLAYVYARMPDQLTEAKDFLLSNMYEEEIGGDRHTDLLIRFAEACGTTADGQCFAGYEMHMGTTEGPDRARPFATLEDGSSDGAVSPDGRVTGTYIHGLFADDHRTVPLAPFSPRCGHPSKSGPRPGPATRARAD